MTFDRNLIDSFLNEIFPLPHHFGIILFIEDDSMQLKEEERIIESIQKIDKEAQIFFGMSKLVISSPKLNNIVIKIPFNGYYCKIKESDSILWEDFKYATASVPSDYCLAEYEKYKKAKTYNLNCFLAEIKFYKNIQGKNIFLQENIIPAEDLWNIKEPSHKGKELANKYKEKSLSSMCNDWKIWLAHSFDYYKESKVRRFLYYTVNIDLDILEDNHTGNFGYRAADLTPALLDYSNFLD